MTLLQNLVLPSGTVEGEAQLYTVQPVTGFPVSIDGELDLRTHFNLLPASTLRKLCGLTEVTLSVSCSGDLRVTVTGISDGVRETVLESEVSEGSKLVIPLSHDLVGVSFSGHGVLNSGCFTVDDAGETVHLALCVCTYRKEELVKDKLSGIERFVSTHPELKKYLKVYVADNGRTLPNLDSDIVRVIPSPNLGGSGGFTRCVMEALGDGVYTHVALNDDDALLDPEVLLRTVSLLSLSKNRDGICIAGTMLNQEEPHLIYESGASLSRFGLTNLGKNLSVLEDEGNLFTSKDKDATYAGWWYAVFPLKAVREKGLPLPLFFKMDDAEYGTRLGLPVVTICGISVWHPPFRSKFNPVNSYYYARNTLTVGCTRGDVTERDVDEVTEKILLEAACTRYGSAELMISGVEDFLRGPDHVFNLCRTGMRSGVTMRTFPLEELRGHYNPVERPKASFKLRKYTFNGCLLPSKGNAEASVSSMRTEQFYRAKHVVFDIDGTVGTVSRRHALEAMGITMKVWSLRRMLKKRLPELNTMYRESLVQWTTTDAWNKLF